MQILSNLSINGTLGLNSVADANTDTDKFLVIDSSGIVKYRTGAELYSDIGAGGAAAYTSVLQHTVKAGEDMTKGQAVYVSSADGTNMIVSKASNASEQTSSKTLGIIAQNMLTNDQGFVVTEGLLSGIDTSNAAAGDPVWLGTNGNLLFGLLSKPYAPAHLVFIGIVTRAQQNNGEIFVKVQNGFELNELHNVQITTTPSDNTVLSYEYSSALYKMKSIPTILGYTPADSERTLTINGTSYNLNVDRTWNVGTTTGSGVSGQVAYWNGTTSQTGSSSLFWDATLNRLGVGLNNPQRKVEIYSTNPDSHLRISGSAPSVSLGEAITGSIYQAKFGLATSSGHYSSSAAAGDFVIISQTGATIWVTGTTDRLRLNYSGNFSIGNTNDTHKLDVSGTGRFSSSVTATEFILDNGSADGGQLVLASSGYGNWNVDNYSGSLRAYYGSTEFIRLMNNGQLRLNTYTSSSAWTGTAVATLGVDSSGNVITITGGGVTSFNTRTGAVTLSSSDVTTALGYTPYNSSNPNGYISSYTETDTLASVTSRGNSTTSILYVYPNLSAEPYVSAHFYNTNSSTTRYGGVLVSGIEQAHLRLMYGSNDWASASAKKWQIRVRMDNSQDLFKIFNWQSGKDVWSINSSAEEFLAAEDNGTATSRRYYNYASNEHRFYAVNAAGATTAVKLMEYDGGSYQRVLTTGNYSSYALPLSGGTMSGDITLAGYRVKDLTSTNRGVFIGNWGGAGYWGLGSTSNAHELKLDQVGPSTGFWEGATDVNLYLGSNRLVLHSANYSSYALPLSGGTLTGTLTVNTNANQVAYFQSPNPNTWVDIISTTRTWSLGSTASSTFAVYDRASNITRMEVDASSNLYAYGSMRAPIFYDSNDTGYYGDFASTSRMNSIVFDNLRCAADQNYGFLGRNVYADTVNGIGSDPLELNYYDGGEVHIGAGYTKTLRAGALYSSGASYGTIFYDTNNTSYYLDLNSTTSLRTVGSWRADSSSWDGEFSGKIQYHSNHWYIQAADLLIYRNSGGSNVFTVNQSGNISANYVNAPQGYVSNGNPWSTANSAYFPNGITTAGGTNWVYGLTYLGNAPANGSGAEVASNGRIYVRANSAAASHGFSGLFIDRNNGSSNYVPWSFENEYGNHSWGIVARFHITNSVGDRPSIQFSHNTNNTRWSVGYCYPDDNFRITQNHGMRPDNSTNDGWGTERFRINTDGNTLIFASLGIGSVTPDVRLSVNGDAHVSNIMYMGGTAGSVGSWGTRTYGYGGDWTTNARTIRFDNVGYGTSWSLTIDTGGNVQSSASMRAPIFYDSENTSFYLDPNGTSNLNTWTWETSARIGRPYYWTNRLSKTGAQGHQTGTNGWGMEEGGWDTAWKGGFSGWDIWGTGTGHPQGSGYIHAQGIISGLHHTNADGSNSYGWMMVGAHNATENRYWLRGRWSNSVSGWTEMITTNNIGSQSVGYANNAGSATNLYGGAGAYIQSASVGTSYQYNYQVRENAGGYANTNEAYAPQLAFHWAGVVASSIMMESSGRIAIRNNPGDGYENFVANVLFGASVSVNNQVYGSPYQATLGPFSAGLYNNQYVGLKVTDVNSPSYYSFVSSNEISLYTGYGASAQFTPGQISFNSASCGGGNGGGYAYYSNSTASGYDGSSYGGDFNISFSQLRTWSNYYGEGLQCQAWDNANLYIGGTLYQNNWSDEKYKDNVLDIEDALGKINSIRGVEYDWNDLAFEETGREGHDVGVIAQEVQAVYPFAVREVDKERQDYVQTSLVVDYEKLIPLLVQSVKELSAEVSVLKIEIQTLKDRIDGSGI